MSFQQPDPDHGPPGGEESVQPIQMAEPPRGPVALTMPSSSDSQASDAGGNLIGQTTDGPATKDQPDNVMESSDIGNVAGKIDDSPMIRAAVDTTSLVPPVVSASMDGAEDKRSFDGPKHTPTTDHAPVVQSRPPTEPVTSNEAARHQAEPMESDQPTLIRSNLEQPQDANVSELNQMLEPKQPVKVPDKVTESVPTADPPMEADHSQSDAAVTDPTVVDPPQQMIADSAPKLQDNPPDAPGAHLPAVAAAHLPDKPSSPPYQPTTADTQFTPLSTESSSATTQPPPPKPMDTQSASDSIQPSHPEKLPEMAISQHSTPNPKCETKAPCSNLPAESHPTGLQKSSSDLPTSSDLPANSPPASIPPTHGLLPVPHVVTPGLNPLSSANSPPSSGSSSPPMTHQREHPQLPVPSDTEQSSSSLPDSNSQPNSQTPSTPPSAEKSPQFPHMRSNPSSKVKKSFFSIDQLLKRKESEQSHVTVQGPSVKDPVAPLQANRPSEASTSESMEIDPTPTPIPKSIEVPPHYSDGPLDLQQKTEPAAAKSPGAAPSLLSFNSESKDGRKSTFKLPSAYQVNEEPSNSQSVLDGEASSSAAERPVSPVLGFSEDANLSMQMTDRRDINAQRTTFSGGQYDRNEDSATAWSGLGEDSCSRFEDGASMDGLPVHKPPSPVLTFSEDANLSMALAGEESNAAADSMSASQQMETMDSNSMASVTMSDTTSLMAPSDCTTQTTPGPPRTGGKKRRSCHHFESPLTTQAKKRLSEGLPLPNLVEFKWPQNNNGEYYFLQEQVSVFLEITSFKRKYPDIFRKTLDIEQRIFLKDKGLVTEAECDIGLTAVRSVEMKKLMRDDYPDKWALFRVAMQEKERLKRLRYKENKAMKDKERREMMKERAALQLQSESIFAEQGMTADRLIEYQWPQDKSGEYYMLQEQVSMFCEVLSFKRKYPDLYRRPLEVDERVHLMEKGMVCEIQCDLGLTALKSEEVMDLFAKDYPEKYKEYTAILRERERIQIRERRKEMEIAMSDKVKMKEIVKKAVKAAAEFNVHFNRERRDERKAYLDMQTNMIHYPVSKRKVVPAEATKTDAYPVALIPGQFQDYYKRYTPQQLKYFPVNSVVYSSPKKFASIYVDPSAPPDTETEQSSQADDASQSDSSSSSESEDSSSESEVEPESGRSETPVSSRASTPMRTTPRRPGRPPKMGRPHPVMSRSSNILCYLCKEPADKNKIGESEDLVKCSECSRHGHPSCLELSTEMIGVIKTYPWQCMECKTCIECMDPYDEDKMMFCDHCDRGYHTFCVGLRTIPTGRWECQSCRKDEPKIKRPRMR